MVIENVKMKIVIGGYDISLIFKEMNDYCIEYII